MPFSLGERGGGGVLCGNRKGPCQLPSDLSELNIKSHSIHRLRAPPFNKHAFRWTLDVYYILCSTLMSACFEFKTLSTWTGMVVKIP